MNQQIKFTPVKKATHKAFMIEDADYFENFNWDNFKINDIVWLEDCDEVEEMAAWYMGITSDQVVHLVGISDYQIKYIATQ